MFGRRASTSRRSSAICSIDEQARDQATDDHDLGHLRNNGPPGWMVLGRAFERLVLLESGWIAHENVINGQPPRDGWVEAHPLGRTMTTSSRACRRIALCSFVAPFGS